MIITDEMTKLVTAIKTDFDDVAGKRQGYEKIWLQDLRQYKGIYDPEVKAKMDPKRSQAYIRETRTKVRTIDARVMDLLFPANGEKNWAIGPTPDPEFPPEIEAEIMQGLQAAKDQAVRALAEQQIAQAQAQGEQVQPLPELPQIPVTDEEFQAGRKAAAEQIAKKMEKEINDQLTDIKYRDIIRDTVHSGHLYGTGVLKGPLAYYQTKNKWTLVKEDEQARWVLQKVNELRPYIEFRPIWNIYPDLSATKIDDARFIIERHVMPKHKVLDLASRQDFNGEAIREFVTTNPGGDCQLTSFENELYNLKEFNQAPTNVRGSYQVLEYWGYVDAGLFVSALPSGSAEQQEALDIINDQQVFANIWVLGSYIIKMVIQPVEGVLLPYYFYFFDKDETSFFGEGVATIMRDPQRLVNASVRAMIDNASHCAGPQYEVNIDLLDAEEDVTDIGAFKVWMRTGRDADVAGKEAVRIKQISSYTPEFMQMWAAFSKSGDEVTIIPRYLQGDSRVSGAGRTAAGLSMLMGQANVGLSDLVKMYDDGITKPFITAMYHWNMQFNSKPDIKGDMVPVAKGSTALMAKEIRAQQIQMFLGMTANPLDAPWTKRNNLLAEWARCTDIAEVDAVRTQEEYDQQMAQQAAAQKQIQAENTQLEMAKIQAEQQAKADANSEQLDMIESAIRDLSNRIRRVEGGKGALTTRVPTEADQMLREGGVLNA